MAYFDKHSPGANWIQVLELVCSHEGIKCGPRGGLKPNLNPTGMEIVMQIKAETTKSGVPALWESGGGMSSTGHAQIVSGMDGEARRPVYIKRGGSLSCGEHALIAIREGYYVVKAWQHNRDFQISVSRITKTSVRDVDGESWEASAEVALVNQFEKGEWANPLDPKLEAAVTAAKSKATAYHCRSAVFIDTSVKPEPPEAEKARRAKAALEQEEQRARLRREKGAHEAQAQAQAEAASQSAKQGGLGARLETANNRLAALGARLIELGESSFKWSWQTLLYTEENVGRVEREVEQIEKGLLEKERQRQMRAEFQPQFEALKPRAETLGLVIETEGVVEVGHDRYDYTSQGLAALIEQLSQKEREVVEARAKAVADATYQGRKAVAKAAGLPSDIRIWCRRGGRTNAGDGWVIGPDGQDRDNTAWNNPRPRYPDEGDKIWEQILEGELVIRWRKSSSAAEHVFEVVHLPMEVTEAQIERILEIQDELERQWEGARGLASGLPSPSVGKGWNLK